MLSQIKQHRQLIVRCLIVIGIVVIIILLFLYKDEIQELQNYGYAGIFLVSIAANATIIIPLPGVVLTTTMGAIFHPLGVALSAGLGATLGELSGYLAGFSGQAVLENSERYERLLNWMQLHQRSAYLAVAVLAFIPNPLFDLAGMAAGALKFPLWKFLLPCAVGKVLKMVLFAYAGYYSIEWLMA